MRHGFEWWETFWKWMLEEGRKYDRKGVQIKKVGEWLVFRKAEFEILWREGHFDIKGEISKNER